MENEKNGEKVSLEALIRKKLDRDEKKAAVKDIYVECLGGYLTVRNPSDAQRIELADKGKSGEYADLIEGYVKLIYDCCDILHSEELQEEIGVKYPYDTVKALFDPEEIAEIGLEISDFFGKRKEKGDETDEADENLKN